MLSNMLVEVTLQAGFYKEKHVVPMVSMNNRPMMLVRDLEIAPLIGNYRALCEGRTVAFGLIEGIRVSGRRADLEA